MEESGQSPKVVDDLDRSLAALREHGRGSFSSCLLYDGVSRYWCREADGFVGYLAGRSIHVVIGEPVCRERDYALVAREFAAFSKRQKADCVFAAVGQSFLDQVADGRTMAVSVGDDLVFDVGTYAARGNGAKKIRSSVNQLARRGGNVVEYRRATGPDAGLDAALAALVAAWLDGPEKLDLHFLDVDLFRFTELKRYFYVELGGEIMGLLTCLPIFARNGFLFEDVIRHPDAPPGAVEAMTLEALCRFRAEGREMATFGPSLRPRLDGCRGLSSFNRAVARLLIPLAARLGRLPGHYHARKKFGGLQVEPIYLVMQEGEISWRGFYNLLRLFHLVQVPRFRIPATMVRRAAPGSRGATTGNIGNIRGRSNATRRDAPPGTRRRNSATGY